MKEEAKFAFKVKKKDIKVWVDALRSGKYQQTGEQLNDHNGYCCLGVACDLFVKREDLKLERGYIEGGLPEDQDFAPGWLKHVNMDFYHRTGKELSVLNDQGFTGVDGKEYPAMSFEEIADVLEAVYIKEVLK